MSMNMTIAALAYGLAKFCLICYKAMRNWSIFDDLRYDISYYVTILDGGFFSLVAHNKLDLRYRKTNEI